VFHRRSHVIGLTEALAWTLVWVVVSLAFNVLVFYLYDRHWLGIGLKVGHAMSGKEAALKFFTAYLLEKSLSVDNIFVIAMIFTYFRVPAMYQHRVLFWGILGALVMRGVMIGAGTALVNRLEWMIYVFGAFLIFTGLKLALAKGREVTPDKNPVLRLLRAVLPLSDNYVGGRFFARHHLLYT
jgi:tellurite resistance protein TerC